MFVKQRGKRAIIGRSSIERKYVCGFMYRNMYRQCLNRDITITETINTNTITETILLQRHYVRFLPLQTQCPV